MPRRQHISFPFGNMRDGINRYLEEAGPNQCVDALNVIADKGEVRRRDALVSFMSGPAYNLPAGRCGVVSEDSGATQTTHADRDPTLTESANPRYVYVGSKRSITGQTPMFSGIDVAQISYVGTPTTITELRVHYWNGSAWTLVPHFIDETRRIVNDRWRSLCGNGLIYWHLKQIEGDWAETAVDGTTGYWVRLSFVNPAGTEVNPTTGMTSITIGQRGLHVFQLEPITGLIPTRISNRPSIVLCSDRKKIRGREKGSQVGIRDNFIESTKIPLIVSDEGGGMYGQITFPQWGGPAAPPAAGTFGTASQITKGQQNYKWNVDQFRGGQLRTFTATSGTVNTIIFTSILRSDDLQEHCIIRCTANGSGTGTPLNEERQCWSSDATAVTETLYIYDDWSIAPDNQNEFEIIAPPGYVRFLDEVDLRYQAKSNGNHNLLWENARPYADSISRSSGPVHWEVGREPRFVLHSGTKWSSTINTNTGLLLMANGKAPILEYDGKTLRELKADYLSAKALALEGVLPDIPEIEQDEDPQPNTKATLRRMPPNGKFIETFHNRIFVAGFQGDPYRIAWSYPGGASDIWPKAYETIVRDQHQHPITGIRAIGDALAVFTPTSIHMSDGPTEKGQYTFRPAVQGAGFVSHHAVTQVSAGSSSNLVGVAPDGIYLFNGSDVEPVLDEWDRLIDGGINQGALSNAVAVAAPQKGWVVFAVPSSDSTENNRIIVWDYIRQTMWLWSAPFGVASLGVDFEMGGRERILFGSYDGLVATLGNATTDDGTAISAHATSPPMHPGGGRDLSMIAASVLLKSLGSNETVDVDVFGSDDDTDSVLDGTVYVDRGEAQWNTATWGTDKWATSKAYKQVRLNCVSGTREHRVQLKISGTSRWGMKAAELIALPRSRRGR